MPRYHFCIQYNGSITDLEALDLADNHAAWQAATKLSGETILKIDGHLKYESEWRMDVQDEQLEPLFTLRFLTECHQ